LGTPDWPGAFGEFVVVPQEAVFSLPDHLTYVQGSLIEPLTVAVHVARLVELRPDQSVAILGSGSIGGMVSGVCSALGATPIIVADVQQHCLDAARERLGATLDILLPDDELVDKVVELTSGRGVDVSFITADDASLVNRAIGMTRRRGCIVLVALLTHSPLNFSAYPIIGKELRLVGSSMCNHRDVSEAIGLAASRRVDVEGILTHVLPIEEAQRGLHLADTKEDGAIKVVLSFDL
jgi:L-iditol 2-dehydrogenase